MKKTNLTLKDGLGLLIERADYKGKLRHIDLNNNQDDTDCYVVYNTAICNHQHHICQKDAHIVSPFIHSNCESYSDAWIYEDDEEEDELQPNHIEYKYDIDYLLTQTSERSLIDSLLDYMSVSDIDEWFKRFMPCC